MIARIFIVCFILLVSVSPAHAFDGNESFQLELRQTESGSALAVDKMLNLPMPNKTTLSFKSRDTYLDSDSDYLDRIQVSGDVPQNRVLGFRLDYRF